MRRHRILIALPCLLLGFLAASLAHAAANDKELPDGRISLTRDQCLTLRKIIQGDKEAAETFGPIHRAAERVLAENPDPIETIAGEGKLARDPAFIRTARSMADTGKASALAWAYAATGDARYAEKAKAFVLAWARVNHPTGDPINETNLDGLFIAYDLCRAHFSEGEQHEANQWLRAVDAAEDRACKAAPRSGTRYNNFDSHRLKIRGMVACSLGEHKEIAQLVEDFKTHIEKNLNADGTSEDFLERDAMHYHTYDLRPLLDLARAIHHDAPHLYHYRAPNGASLEKSVRFMVPFATGEKVHMEFLHTKVAFDRERAAAGQKEYMPHPAAPESTLYALTPALWFDPALKPAYFKASRKPESKYPEWQFVLDAAKGPQQPKSTP